MIYYEGKPHLPLILEGGGFMYDTIDISTVASIITIALFLIQVLRYLKRLLLYYYKRVIHKIAKDVAADIYCIVKKGEKANSIEKADYDNQAISKGG